MSFIDKLVAAEKAAADNAERFRQQQLQQQNAKREIASMVDPAAHELRDFIASQEGQRILQFFQKTGCKMLLPHIVKKSWFDSIRLDSRRCYLTGDGLIVETWLRDTSGGVYKSGGRRGGWKEYKGICQLRADNGMNPFGVIEEIKAYATAEADKLLKS